MAFCRTIGFKADLTSGGFFVDIPEMTDQTSQPETLTAPSPLNAIETRGLIRKELDRNNKYLEFAQGQIQKDRDFYKHLYQAAAAFIVFIVAVAGFFQYTSVSQMRNDIKASLDTAQNTVKDELSNVRTEVKNRIDDEFRKENITALVAEAAKERTEKEILGVLRSEVAKAIDEQKGTIEQAVVDQTKAAVNALQPQIKSDIETVTRNEISASVAPINEQMKLYGLFIDLGNTAILARSDDRAAFELLLEIALGERPEPEYKNPQIVKLADATASAVIAEKQYGLRLSISFKTKQTPDEMKKFLFSNNPMEREAALDNYPQDDKSILPDLIKVIRSDNNLTVLHKAVNKFNALTGQSFLFWQIQDVLDWWDKNHMSYEGSSP